MYEPFVGGGAFWLDLFHKNNHINDLNYDVINFYVQLKNQPETLIKKINDLAKEYNTIDKTNITKEDFELLAEKYYYFYRDTRFSSNFDKAIAFYMIRQLCFSGMIRYNKDGIFNVPFGWYKSFPGIEQDINLIKQIFQNTTITNLTWKNSLEELTSDDFVFLDPPYTTKFKDYNGENKFGENEHKELFEWFCTTDSKALIVLNLDRFTEELYKKYIKNTYKHTYNIRYRDRISKEQNTNIHFIATNYNININILD